MYTADVLSSATTAYPLDTYYTGEEMWTLYFDASQKEIEYVGDLVEFSNMIEGAENWLVAKHGAHLPPCFRDKADYQWIDQANVQVVVEDADLEPGTAAARLRRREKRAGRTLLQVEAKSGLRVLDHPRYRVPEGAEADEEGDD